MFHESLTYQAILESSFRYMQTSWVVEHFMHYKIWSYGACNFGKVDQG